MAQPRVLLVEDDALLRRFVRMALEELPIELLECESVAGALQILGTAPVQLILTDLMLPGASGVDLLQQLQQSPCLRGQAKVVVLSAGLTQDTRQQLAPLGVWRLLEKPVSVGLLEQCVQEAVQGDPPAPIPPQPAPADLERTNAIDQYFAGDTELFQLYRGSCLLQLPHDIATGDQAVEDADLPALRRVAHSLKTVLLTLGAPQLSAQARDLEQLCHSAAPGPAHSGWLVLRVALAHWIDVQKTGL
ncbi:Hpt domain-containing protein [Rhodoferax sp. OV413]|uniref:Hpt domain-containing response regulator n=1 Tax=Rhodoferax sp. OV413 TaxID=1855285 RepID=UPI000889843B|nr:response regulator [Rhodoferax sp. OV413]SDO18760.1 Hpt domain-containing protein [Rhodoferax sp. OV413]